MADTCMIESLSTDLSILSNIFSRLSRNDNCTNARVCRSWNIPAVQSIWRHSDPKIFLALGDARLNAFGTIVWFFSPLRCSAECSFHLDQSFQYPPTSVQWERFRKLCQYVEFFEDDAQGQRVRYWFKHVVLRDNNAPTILFPNLRVLKIGINNVQAFNAPSVTALSLVLLPELVLQDRRQMISIVRHLPTSLPNVTSLTLLGPPRAHKYTEDIIRICHAFKSIKALVFSPSMINIRVLQSIASIRPLHSIDVTEYYSHIGRSSIPRTTKPLIGPNGIKLNRLSFSQLSRISLTIEGFTHFERLLSTRNFPARSLTSLWARFDTGHSYSSDTVYCIFESVIKHCRSLRSLTLRFCPPYSLNVQTINKVEVIHYSDFRSFLCLPHLVEFSIDHTLPLSITDNDILDLSRRASAYRILWLNPYPGVVIEVDDWVVPTLQALRHFATHCPTLERLGIFLDATTPISPKIQTEALSNLQVLR